MWFLAAYYSPDLNSIEEAFSKVKAHLRKEAARRPKKASLVEAMREALWAAVTPRDVAGWFAHYCGYAVADQPS